MSPVWLEEWETAKIIAAASVEAMVDATVAGAETEAGSAGGGTGDAGACECGGRGRVVCVELHSACASNRGRSHVQVVLPHPDHVLSPNDRVVFLRRIQCHYNPVFVEGQPNVRLADLPEAVRKFCHLAPKCE